MDLSTTLHLELHSLVDDALSDNPRHALIATRVLRSNEPGWGQRDAANFFRFRRDEPLATELRAWEAPPPN
jgi:hypothetical protein